ncbi:MAG: hypothetical protein HYS27_04900 [Deltaproteobacteria bacterium]|nr:hypothetical protein [Deltaproteobacteria bacterium]
MADDIGSRTDKQIEELSDQLLVFARGRARRLWWFRGPGTADLPKGNQVEDIVAETMADVLGQTRPWNPSVHPKLFDHLTSVVNSKLWNLHKSKDNRTTDGGADADAVAVRADDLDLTPLTHLESKEEQALRDHVYGMFIDEISKNNDLVRIHDLIVDEGIEKPRELATRLGLDVGKVYRLKEKLTAITAKIHAVFVAETNKN